MVGVLALMIAIACLERSCDKWEADGLSDEESPKDNPHRDFECIHARECDLCKSLSKLEELLSNRPKDTSEL